MCDKTVYQLEKMQVDTMCMHKACFKCATSVELKSIRVLRAAVASSCAAILLTLMYLRCHRQLTISNYAAINNTLYCKTHYVQMFKDSGGSYAAFGDAGFKQKSSRTTAAAEAMAERSHSSSTAAGSPKPAHKKPPAAPAAAVTKKPSWAKKKEDAASGKRSPLQRSARTDGPPATAEQAVKGKGKTTSLTPYAKSLLRPHSPTRDGDEADVGALQAKVKAQAATIADLKAQVSKLTQTLAAASSSARAVADQLEKALH